MLKFGLDVGWSGGVGVLNVSFPGRVGTFVLLAKQVYLSSQVAKETDMGCVRRDFLFCYAGSRFLL